MFASARRCCPICSRQQSQRTTRRTPSRFDGLPPGVVAQRTRHRLQATSVQVRLRQLRAERRSFSFARDSIWRTRSRDRCSRSPISCSVRGSSSSSPKRRRTTSRSLPSRSRSAAAELVEVGLVNQLVLDRQPDRCGSTIAQRSRASCRRRRSGSLSDTSSPPCPSVGEQLRRKRERARLIGEHVHHRLAHPPDRVGDELDVARRDRTGAPLRSGRDCLRGSDRGTTRRGRGSASRSETTKRRLASTSRAERGFVAIVAGCARRARAPRRRSGAEVLRSRAGRRPSVLPSLHRRLDTREAYSNSEVK